MFEKVALSDEFSGSQGSATGVWREMINSVESRPAEDPQATRPFRVWMRPMGKSWKIAVEAGHEAKWLTQRLAEHGFDSVDLLQDAEDLHCTFRCLTNHPSERKSIENLLNNWPEVQLQLTPEFPSGKTKASPSPHLSSEPLHRPAQPETAAQDIAPFRVWIRPLGNAWKLRVEGTDSPEWLRNELEHRGLTCSALEPVPNTQMHVFRCMSETPHESSYVWNLLKALPQVLLQNDPA